LGKQLIKVIRQQDEDGKTAFSFIERAGRKEVKQIKKTDEEELGLENLETKGWK
jgi:ribosome recycling factor